ncbi:MAG: hypothetical protein IJH76_00410 [Clostridia bacterium]|nr:hypothetical protein [Clostridia bacterium]
MNLEKEESIQMKIARTAARNWGQQEPTNLEESLRITWDSEAAAVKGIIETLGLDVNIEEQLIGTKDDNGKLLRNGEIYTRASISEDVASKIQAKLKDGVKNQRILNILSTIHDAWVKNNKNNFMKVNDNGERRNKERQFVPLELLDWGEVQSDLLFLKPILEGAGIEIDEEQLKQVFDVRQQKYIVDNQIFSHQDLVNHLSKGHENYPALEGLETKFGGNIDELLKNPQIQEEMATQIESRVVIKANGKLAREIMDSENPVLDDIIGYFEQDSDKNYVVTKRDLLIKKLMGEEIPSDLKGVFPGTYDGEMAENQVHERRQKYNEGKKVREKFYRILDNPKNEEFGIVKTWETEAQQGGGPTRLRSKEMSTRGDVMDYFYFSTQHAEYIGDYTIHKSFEGQPKEGEEDYEKYIAEKEKYEKKKEEVAKDENFKVLRTINVRNVPIIVSNEDLMNAGLVDWCKTKEQGKEEVTAIATRQKESKFKAFMQKIKMALTRNKNKEQDNERK